MVDTASSVVGGNSNTQTKITKRLLFGQGKIPEYTQAIRSFLSSLENSQLTSAFIPEDLTVIGMPGGMQLTSLKNAQLPVDYENRDNNQNAKLYPDDLLNIFKDIESWVLQTSREKQQQVRKGDAVDIALHTLLPQLQSGELSYADLAGGEKHQKLQDALHELIELVGHEEEQATQEEIDYTSLAKLIGELKSNPKAALERWQSDIVPLAQAFAAATVGERFVRAQTPPSTVEPTTTTMYFEPEGEDSIRRVFREFILAMRKVIADPKLWSDELKRKYPDITLEQVLQASEIDRIKNDGELIFPLQLAQSVLLESNLVVADDLVKIANIMDLFEKNEVMARLLGLKELKLETAPAGDGAPEGAETEGNLPEEKKPAEETQLYRSEAEKIWLEAVLDVLLDQPAFTAALPATIPQRRKFVDITRQLLISNLLLQVGSGLMIDAYQQLHDQVPNQTIRERGVFVRAAFMQWLDDNVVAQAERILNERLAAQPDFAQAVVDQAAEYLKLSSQKPEDIPDPAVAAEQMKAATSGPPLTEAELQALTEIYKVSSLEEFAAKPNLAHFRKLQGTVEYGQLQTRLSSLMVAYLQNQGLSGASYELFMANGELRQLLNGEITDFLQEVSKDWGPEQFLRLQDPTFALLLAAQFNRRLLLKQFSSAKLGALLDTFVEGQKAVESARRQTDQDQLLTDLLSGADGNLKLQIEQTLDTLFVAFPSEQARIDFVQSLTARQIREYFGITLADDEQLRLFKQKLLHYVELRSFDDPFAQRAHISPDDSAEDVTEQDFLYYRRLVKEHGAPKIQLVLTTPYDEEPDEALLAQIDEERQRVLEFRERVVNELWKNLVQEGYEADQTPPAGWAPGAAMRDYAGVTPQKQRRGLQKYWNRLGGRKSKQPKDLLKNSMDKGATKLASAALGAIPFVGGAAAALLQVLPENIRKILSTGILGILATIIGSTLYAFATSWGGFIGGALGGYLFGAPGFVGGTWLGYGIQRGLEAALGVKIGGPTNPSFALNSASKALTPTTASASAPLTLPASNVVLTSSAVAGGLIGLGYITQVTIHNAFLQPLPTIDSQGEISKYVTIEKRANPGVNFKDITEGHFPIKITYSISIKANKGYDLTINEITDTIATTYNKELKPNDTKPDKVRQAVDFQQTVPVTLKNGEALILPDYEENYDQSYMHSNVTNTISIKFAATKDGITENDTAKTAEVICFGECPQNQAGCWPASGYIRQLPYGSYSHKVVDAVDIAGSGPIFSPFDGEAYFYFWNEGGISPAYGHHVFVDSGDFALAYGHFQSFSPALDIKQTGVKREIKAGTFLGTMGTTGNSSGVHLHWEIRVPGNGFGGFTSQIPGQRFNSPTPTKLESTSPDGKKFVLDSFVRTCYVNNDS